MEVWASDTDGAKLDVVSSTGPGNAVRVSERPQRLRNKPSTFDLSDVIELTDSSEPEVDSNTAQVKHSYQLRKRKRLPSNETRDGVSSSISAHNNRPPKQLKRERKAGTSIRIANTCPLLIHVIYMLAI